MPSNKISPRHQQQIEALRAATPTRPPDFTDDVAGAPGESAPPAAPSLESGAPSVSTAAPLPTSAPSPAPASVSSSTPPLPSPAATSITAPKLSEPTAKADDGLGSVADYERKLAQSAEANAALQHKLDSLEGLINDSKSKSEEQSKAVTEELERLRGVERAHQEMLRATAMQVSPEEAALIGGEEAMKVVRKLIEGAVAQTRADVLKEAGSLVEGKFSRVGAIAKEEFGRMTQQEKEAADKAKFTNSVYKVVPNWNALASDSKFLEFLDEDRLSRRLVVNNIFKRLDGSEEALQFLSALVAKFNQGKTAVSSFEAPAATSSSAMNSAPETKTQFDSVAYQKALRSGDFAAANAMRKNL